VNVRLCIGIHGEKALPWDYFLLQAARGSVRVPDWVNGALPGAVATCLGLDPDEVDSDDLERAIGLLPDDPQPWLARLFKPVEREVPDPARDAFKLEDRATLGAFREAVSQYDLLHDAALIILADYGRDGFYACLESLEPDDWDARGAVAAMIYVFMIRGG
jgi:hypothetical protein